MFAVAVIPDFELNAVLRHNAGMRDHPVALLFEDSKKARIQQLTPAAAKAGVALGMTSTQGKARCPALTFQLRSLEQEESANQILLECAYQRAAFIESTAPGVCTLDLRGLAVADEEEAQRETWGLKLVQLLEQFSLPIQVGFAATPLLAIHAARIARPVRQISNPESFWDSLPISEIAPSSVREILAKWGIRTAGQFLRLGKDRIGERLGHDGLLLFDEVRADQVRPLNLTVPKQVYEEFFEFEQPIEMLEPLLFIIRRFLDQLTRRLEQAALVIQRMELTLVLESGEPHRRTLEVPAPNREVDVLFRIVHNYLENVRTPAAVKAARMQAIPASPEARQFQLFETAIRNPNHFYETIGRIGALLGDGRVGTPRVQPTHRPDDFGMESIPIDPKPLIPLENPPTRRGLMLRRFRPPLPAKVRLRDQSPIFIDCPQVSSSVTQSAGPWRISGNWWEGSWSREEWDIQTKDGGLYRLFRDNFGWFVDGAYD